MRKIKVFTGQAHKLELEVNQFVTSRNLAIIDLKITGDEVHCVMILIYDELWYREASSLFFIFVDFYNYLWYSISRNITIK